MGMKYKVRIWDKRNNQWITSDELFTPAQVGGFILAGLTIEASASEQTQTTKHHDNTN